MQQDVRENVEYESILRRYAKYASRYDRRWKAYTNATLSKAVEVMAMNGSARLLDVACGTGLLAERLRNEYPQLAITGIDVSPQMLEKARERIPPAAENKVDWLNGHAEKLPVGPEQFDILTCTNAFHLVQDSKAAITEFRRVLKPAGKIILIDWCLDFFTIQMFMRGLRLFDRHSRQVRGLDKMVTFVQSNGFTIEHHERFKATWFWGMMCIVARKTEHHAA